MNAEEFTTHYVRGVIAEIKAFSEGNNPSMAHAAEDKLLLDFVKFCAQAKVSRIVLNMLAREVQEVSKLRFTRACG